MKPQVISPDPVWAKLAQHEDRLDLIDTREYTTRLDPFQAVQNSFWLLSAGLPGTRAVWDSHLLNRHRNGNMRLIRSSNNPTAKADTDRGFLYTNMVRANTEFLYDNATATSWSDDSGVASWADTDREGLTAGLWFRVTSYPSADMGLISAWNAQTSQRSWRLYSENSGSPSGALRLDVSSTGTTVSNTLQTSIVPTAATWVLAIMRWDPSTSLDIQFWEGGVKSTDSNTTSISATLHSTGTLWGFLGAFRDSGGTTQTLNGDVGLAFMSVNLWDDTECDRIFQVSRHIFGV